jgi:hypothetical protein
MTTKKINPECPILYGVIAHGFRYILTLKLLTAELFIHNIMSEIIYRKLAYSFLLG